MRQPNYADNCVLSSGSGGGGVSAADKMPLSDCSASSHSPPQSGGEVLRLRANSITDGGAAAATTRLQTVLGRELKHRQGQTFSILRTAAPVKQ